MPDRYAFSFWSVGTLTWSVFCLDDTGTDLVGFSGVVTSSVMREEAVTLEVPEGTASVSIQFYAGDLAGATTAGAAPMQLTLTAVDLVSLQVPAPEPPPGPGPAPGPAPAPSEPGEPATPRFTG